MENVLESVKHDMPKIRKAVYRQDNAGCYHCVSTVLACKEISDRTGIYIERLDFSDPQGGKGACDRKAAHIKSYLCSYVNEGHSITNAQEMKTAIETSNIPGVRVAVVNARSKEAGQDPKLEGISSFNNFFISDEGVLAYKAYGIGKGQMITWSKFNSMPSFAWFDTLPSPAQFTELSLRKDTTELNSESETSSNEDSDDESNNDNGLFICPDEGCVKVFMRYSSYSTHLLCGQHKRKLERKSLVDRAKLGYAGRLNEGSAKVPVVSTESREGTEATKPQRWALRASAKGRKRFKDRQRRFLESKYQQGEVTGVKAKPEDVSLEMRTVKDSNNKRVFTMEDFLTPQQIQSFFSRLTAKNRKLSEKENEELERQAAIITLREELLDSLDTRHPICYDNNNLCKAEMHSLKSMFKVCQLKDICARYHIKVTGRKKDDFIQAITEFLKTCTCKN